MSLLIIKLVDCDCELLSFHDGCEGKLVFEFVNEDGQNTINGGGELSLNSSELSFVKVGNLSSQIKAGKCTLSLSAIPDGTHSPELIMGKARLPLPSIRKLGENIQIIYPSAEQFSRLADKERALRSRVDELEKTVKGLCSRVYGEPLFVFPDRELIK